MHASSRSAKGAARREQILDAAMGALAMRGNHHLSLRSVARLLGVESAHVVYYFGSRDGLLESVVERWDEMGQAEVGNVEGRPEHILDAYVSVLRRNLRIPGLVHLYLTFSAEAAHPEHRSHEFFRTRFARVTRLLEEGIAWESAAGKMPSGVAAEREARRLVALADGLQLQALIDESLDAPAELAAVIAELRVRP